MLLSYLILCKLAGVLQVHVFFAWGGVVSGQSQAAQRVPARAPLPDLTHELFAQSGRHRYLPCSHAQVLAPLDDTFRGPLSAQEVEEKSSIFGGEVLQLHISMVSMHSSCDSAWVQRCRLTWSLTPALRGNVLLSLDWSCTKLSASRLYLKQNDDCSPSHPTNHFSSANWNLLKLMVYIGLF